MGGHTVIDTNTTQGSLAPNLFGFNLARYAPNTRMAIIISGIYGCYITFFIFQEYIFKSEGFKYGGLETLVQFISSALFGLIERTVRKLPTKPKAPVWVHYRVGFFIATGIGASAYSLMHLNFPTWVLFKSCRALFVMLGGIFILKASYTLLEYIGAMWLVMGLMTFTLADIQVSPSFNFLGVLLVIFALIMDAFLGNYQEKVIREYDVSQNEIIIYSYSSGAVYMLLLLVIFKPDELIEGIEYCQAHPNILFLIFVNCVLSYIGIIFILAVVMEANAVATVLVTSSRKALTIMFSFLLFSKPFSFFYVVGSFMVFGGIMLNVYGKSRKNSHHQQHHHPSKSAV